MKIFLIAKYSGDTKQEIEANVKKAGLAGIEMIRKGHLPFIPQSMFAFWEDEIDMSEIMKTCYAWIKECDAVLVLHQGKIGGGTRSALDFAKQAEKQVFMSLAEIPNSEI